MRSAIELILGPCECTEVLDRLITDGESIGIRTRWSIAGPRTQAQWHDRIVSARGLTPHAAEHRAIIRLAREVER